MKNTLFTLLFCAGFCLSAMAQNGTITHTSAVSVGSAIDDNSARGVSITYDSGEFNKCTAGVFEGSVDFDPDASASLMLDAASGDGFIQMLSYEDQLVWVRQIDADPRAVQVQDGGVIIAGNFTGTVDFNPGAGTAFLTTALNGPRDGFILKLDMNGNFLWVKQLEGPNDDNTILAMDSDDQSIYLTGAFRATVDFNPSPSAQTFKTSNGLFDIFVARLDATGNFVWVQTVGGTGGDFPSDIAQSAGSNTIVVTGNFNGTVDFDPSPASFPLVNTGQYHTGFVLKLDNSGAFGWAKQLDGNTQTNIDEVTTAAIHDEDGEVYVAGFAWGTINFNPPGTGNIFTPLFNAAGYIVKYANNGTFQWAGVLNCAPTAWGYATPVKIAVTEASNGEEVYLCGQIQGDIDFNLNPSALNVLAAAYGMFVMKLSAGGTYKWAEVFDECVASDLAVYQHGGYAKLFVTGSLNGTADLDPSPAVLSLTAVGGADALTVTWEENVFLKSMPDYEKPVSMEKDPSPAMIYPNPTDGLISVQLPPEMETGNVEITDLNGSVVYTGAVHLPLSSIDLNQLQKGVYFARISTGSLVVTERVLLH